jgi:hypothetical protein
MCSLSSARRNENRMLKAQLGRSASTTCMASANGGGSPVLSGRGPMDASEAARLRKMEVG